MLDRLGSWNSGYSGVPTLVDWGEVADIEYRTQSAAIVLGGLLFGTTGGSAVRSIREGAMAAERAEMWWKRLDFGSVRVWVGFLWLRWRRRSRARTNFRRVHLNRANLDKSVILIVPDGEK